MQSASRQPSRVSTAAYLYGLHDKYGREIMAYHWHPGLAGQVRTAYPHLHVGPGAVELLLLITAQRSPQHNALRAEFHRIHIPTRRIALEDIIRLTIEQFQVVPAPPGWDHTLQTSRDHFTSTRTWV